MEIFVGIYLFLSIIAVVAARKRWAYVTKRRLSDQQRDNFAVAMCDELFEMSGEAGEFQRLDPVLAEIPGKLETIEAIRWMKGNGYVVTPDNWGWIQILAAETPEKLALTKREYDKRIQSLNSSNIILGDGNINNNGIQLVAGNDLEVNGFFLTDLASALRFDAKDLDAETRNEAERMADIFDAAAEGSLSQESTLFKTAWGWVRERINEGVGGAIGAGLWAVTASLF